MTANNATANSSSGTLRRTQVAQLVAELTADLGRNSIDLLGYPDVAMRIQRAMTDETVGAPQLATLVAAEPILASRLLCMANSVAFNPRARSVTDLRSAVALVGMDALRCAVVSYAMAQLRASSELVNIAAPLRTLWQNGVLVGAVCLAVARHQGGVDPDVALLAGLLHNVGKLYILTKASRYPELLAEQGALAQLNIDWHAHFGCVLLTQWDLPAAVVEAVGEYEYFDDAAAAGDLDLTGMLYLSTVLAEYRTAPEQLELLMSSHAALQRLGLTAKECLSILSESEQHMASVMELLGM